MGQALYRKYRSKKLSEIVGQPTVTVALSNAIKSQNLSHAYLFTGPRGVGKTSVARILAYEINNLKYEDDTLPIDIIEIDAASNRRIDEIRDLREKVRIAPVNAKYKVYIIDEVHMLTREAFNALLKTLEEPPAHVIFILATTEAHKLPETIVSRTQRYSFRLASTEEVTGLLKEVAKKEKIDIEDNALYLLAEHSGGSLRDALSLLDQVRHSTNKITEHIVRQNLGLPSKDVVLKLIDNIQTSDTKSLISTLKESYEAGANASLLANQMLNSLQKQLATGKNVLPLNQQIILMQELLEVDSSMQPEIQLEISLLKTQLSLIPNIELNSEVFAETKTIDTVIIKPTKEIISKLDLRKIPAKTNNNSSKAAVLHTSSDDDVWPNILTTLQSTHNTLYSVLRMAQPAFNDGEKPSLILKFKFPFHQKRVNDAKNKQIICEVMETHGLKGYEIVCQVIDKKGKVNKSPESNNEPATITKVDPELDQIRDIFGGAVVLE